MQTALLRRRCSRKRETYETRKIWILERESPSQRTQIFWPLARHAAAQLHDQEGRCCPGVGSGQHAVKIAAPEMKSDMVSIIGFSLSHFDMGQASPEYPGKQKWKRPSLGRGEKMVDEQTEVFMEDAMVVATGVMNSGAECCPWHFLWRREGVEARRRPLRYDLAAWVVCGSILSELRDCDAPCPNCGLSFFFAERSVGNCASCIGLCRGPVWHFCNKKWRSFPAATEQWSVLWFWRLVVAVA